MFVADAESILCFCQSCRRCSTSDDQKANVYSIRGAGMMALLVKSKLIGLIYLCLHVSRNVSCTSTRRKYDLNIVMYCIARILLSPHVTTFLETLFAECFPVVCDIAARYDRPLRCTSAGKSHSDTRPYCIYGTPSA